MKDRAHVNGLVLGLVANCLVRRTVSDCPLYHLEGLSLESQITNIEQLSDAEMSEIVCHHQECMEAHSIWA